ncbi:MAG: LysR family transcriptional regulator [candidate division NC10 bacterium]
MQLQVKSKVWLEANGKFIIGEGGITLLEAIDRLGSIQKAARRLGWSYRHTWGYLKNMERNGGMQFVVARHGGTAGGGTTLTPDGVKLLREYRRFQRALQATAKKRSRLLFSY